MTGITKDELMQMARDSGLSFLDGSARAEIDDYIDEELIAFFNAILERAAVECEERTEVMSMHVSIESCNTFNSGLMKAARSIRALKINTGD